jgi:plasmid stabilization system protein ParE
MVKIKFTNKAKTDLDEIWEYSCETWSELKFIFEQGRDYSKLIENLKDIKIK